MISLSPTHCTRIVYSRVKTLGPLTPKPSSSPFSRLQRSGCHLPLVSSTNITFPTASLILHTESTEGPVYPFNHIPSFAAGTTFVVLFSLVTGTPLSCVLTQITSNPFFDRPSYRPSPAQEDAVVVPDSCDRRSGRNPWLGWQIVGQQGANIYEPTFDAVRPPALCVLHSWLTNPLCIQDHDNDNQPYVHPRCQLCNSHADHYKTRAAVQSLETPLV